MTGVGDAPLTTRTSKPADLKAAPHVPPELDVPRTPVSGDLKTMWPRPAVGALVPTSGEEAMTKALSGPSGSQAGSIVS